MSEILVGDIWGLILALPLGLFLAFWMSAVKNRAAVVFGAFFGALIGFVSLMAWASNLPGANGVAVFFGSLFFCSAAALVGAIATDLLLARFTSHQYRPALGH